VENDNLVPDVIENRKKLPPEVKQSIINSIFYNVVMFIIMLILTLIINITYNKLQLSNFENYMKFMQVGLAILTVGIFELAYRKDTIKIGLYGIEFFIYSIAILFVPYMYISLEKLDFLKCISLIYTVYYFAKSLVTFFCVRYNFLKDNISDVKEIVKNEAKGYLDEESTKTLRERKEDELKKNAKLEEKHKADKNIEVQNKKIDNENEEKKVNENVKAQEKKSKRTIKNKVKSLEEKE
jgi:hypothetical protein